MLSLLTRCYAYGYEAGLGRELSEKEIDDCKTVVQEAYSKILQGKSSETNR
jgi:hypothetical protein